MFKPIPMKRIITCTSIAASMSTYHQVYKIKRRKNAQHISLVNISAVWLNATANMLYAMSIKEPRLTMTFSNSFVSLSTLLCTTLYHRYIIAEANKTHALTNIHNDGSATSITTDPTSCELKTETQELDSSTKKL